MGDFEIRSYELAHAQAGFLTNWWGIAFLFLVGGGAFLAGRWPSIPATCRSTGAA